MDSPGGTDAAAGGLTPQLAAVLRSQADDLNLYAGGLLNLLTAALPPELVTVSRKGSLAGRLRGREAPVVTVAVTVGEWRYVLHRPRIGAPATATAAHVVGGIALASEQLAVVEWADRLAGALAKRAEQDAGAAAALERLLR